MKPELLKLEHILPEPNVSKYDIEAFDIEPHTGSIKLPAGDMVDLDLYPIIVAKFSETHSIEFAQNIADKILTNYVYTLLFVIDKLHTDNWKLEIGMYITKCIKSFGRKNLVRGCGCEIYLQLILTLDFNEPLKERWEIIKNYLNETYILQPAIVGSNENYVAEIYEDIKKEYDNFVNIYEEWLRIFPFGFFEHLQPVYFDFPVYCLFLKEATCEFTGVTIYNVPDTSEMVKHCLEMSENLFSKFTNEAFTDKCSVDKIKIELIRKTGDFENKIICKQFTDNLITLAEFVKKWLEMQRTTFILLSYELHLDNIAAPAPPATATHPVPPPEALPITLTFKAEFVDRICSGFEPYFIENGDYKRFKDLIKNCTPAKPHLRFNGVTNQLAHEFIHIRKLTVNDPNTSKLMDWIVAYFMVMNELRTGYVEIIKDTLQNTLYGDKHPCKSPYNIIETILSKK